MSKKRSSWALLEHGGKDDVVGAPGGDADVPAWSRSAPPAQATTNAEVPRPATGAARDGPRPFAGCRRNGGIEPATLGLRVVPGECL